MLGQAGADRLRPMATLGEAHDRPGSGSAVYGVLLDVNLRGALAFDMADILQVRGVPFAFLTGYDRATPPERFGDLHRFQKPASAEALARIASELATANARRR